MVVEAAVVLPAEGGEEDDEDGAAEGVKVIEVKREEAPLPRRNIFGE